MTENKLSFKERYPNHRREVKNGRVTQMCPANGWWRVSIDSEGDEWIEPIAFFANYTFEERSVWDGGKSDWVTQNIIYANSGIGEEWFMEGDYAESSTMTNQRLFYDPDFRLRRDDQDSGQEWLNSIKK